MKGKIKNKFFYIHSRIVRFFDFLITKLLLPLVAIVLSISSWIYPIGNIWVDILDKKFNLLVSFGHIVVGVVFFYTALVLDKIKDRLIM